MSEQKSKSNSQISMIDDGQTAAVSAAPVVVAGVLTGANFDSETSGKMEIITIHSSSEDGGSDAVFLALNGYAYQIPRDTPSKVPTEVAQVLRDAVVTNYKPGAGGVVTEKLMPRFAFSAVPA